MKSVTTAELRNHFRRVSSWLDNGESIEILKRGKPYEVDPIGWTGSGDELYMSVGRQVFASCENG
jgi:hypothetical protein